MELKWWKFAQTVDLPELFLEIPIGIQGLWSTFMMFHWDQRSMGGKIVNVTICKSPTLDLLRYMVVLLVHLCPFVPICFLVIAIFLSDFLPFFDSVQLLNTNVHTFVL